MTSARKLIAAAIATSVPVNSVSPSVSGTAKVGGTLTCSTGTWTGEAPISYAYQWQRGTTDISGATSSSYTAVSGDTGFTLRCKVTASNSGGDGTPAYTANTAVVAVVGQQAYTTAGTYSWTCPAGVTSVSVVAVGPGGNSAGGWPGGGGALTYRNNVSVTPGTNYTIVVGGAGSGTATTAFSMVAGAGGTNGSTAGGTPSGTYTAGFSGGSGTANAGGGGGAAGYAGNGGNGGSNGGTNGSNGSGGGGGGGGFGNSATYSGKGGGVRLKGQGANGSGGTSSYSTFGGNGGTGSNDFSGANAEDYGGGGGSNNTGGGVGGVRIIWPGNARSFPSKRTTDE